MCVRPLALGGPAAYLLAGAALYAAILFLSTSQHDAADSGAAEHDLLTQMRADHEARIALDQRLKARQEFDCLRVEVAVAIRDGRLTLDDGVVQIRNYCQKHYHEFLDRLTEVYGPDALDREIGVLLSLTLDEDESPSEPCVPCP
jgi:hypothetical protein